MVKARKYVVKKYFEGLPKKTDFEIVEYEVPALKDNEKLVKTEYISVDPYLRAYNRRFPLPYDQFGYQVGKVVESKSAQYPVGTRVVSHKGWADHVVVKSSEGADALDAMAKLDAPYKLPELGDLPVSLSIGAVGMPGATAYFGLFEICKPVAGETLVVSGAAGAVGSLVGQFGKIHGCRVIGFAGSDDKVAWLRDELGFDHAFNYKTTDITKALREAAPKGIDCYFDNVGGEFSSAVLAQMNEFGRVSVCGSISAYNEDPTKIPKATLLQPSIVFKQLKVEGFIVTRWQNRWPEAFKQIIAWVKSGKLVVKEHVTEGFDNIYDAFVGMLAGENKGKAIVKV